MNGVREGCDEGWEAVTGLRRELEHLRGRLLLDLSARPMIRHSRGASIELAK